MDLLKGFPSSANSEIWVATEGQQIFTLTSGKYAINRNQIDVYLYGVKQHTGEHFVESSPTSFKLNSPVKVGTIVEAKWIEKAYDSISLGHGKNHRAGGIDELNIKHLAGYDEIHYYTNVKEFGAVGDGITDDTAAIQRAFDRMAEIGGTLFFPRGTYKITSSIKPKPFRSPAVERDGGISILGENMYNTSLLYTGNEYCLDFLYWADNMTDPNSQRGWAFDALWFTNFQIDTETGGGIKLPQGGQVYFDGVFFNGAAEDKWALYMPGNVYNQYGIYMIEITRCRFWRTENKGGFKGRCIYVNDYHTFSLKDTFISQQRYNGSLVVISNGKNASITDTAIEGFKNNGVSPTDMTMVEISGYNNNVKFRNFYLEGNWNYGIKLTNGASKNVSIDTMFAWCYESTTAEILNTVENNGNDVVIAKYVTFKSDTQLPSDVYIINDPHKVIDLEYFNNNSTYSIGQQRPVTQPGTSGGSSMSGKSGENILINPGLYADKVNEAPVFVDMVGGTYEFSQLSPSGCRVIQKDNSGNICRLRFYSAEPLNKYDLYTMIVVGKNNGSTSSEMHIYVDASGDNNDGGFALPPAGSSFTRSVKISKQLNENANIVDLVAYGEYDIDIHAVYLIPNDTDEVPYGAEIVSATKIHLGRQITYGIGIPTRGIYHPGDIVFNSQPRQGSYLGWVCTYYGKMHEQSIANVTSGSNIITNVTNVGTWEIGDRIKSYGINGLATVISVNKTNNSISIDQNCSVTYSGVYLLGEAEFMPFGTIEVESQRKEIYADNVPTTGKWIQGDIVWNKYPTNGGHLGWVCTASGRYNAPTTGVTGSISAFSNILTVNKHEPFLLYDIVSVGSLSKQLIVGFDYNGANGSPRIILEGPADANYTNVKIEYETPTWKTFGTVGETQLIEQTKTLPTATVSHRGKMISILGNTGVAEIASLTITNGCTTDGNVTINLDGKSFQIALTTTQNTANLVAEAIRTTTFDGWTTSGTNATVVFTCNITGNKANGTYSAGSTGATGTMSTTTQGVDSTGDKVYVCKKLANDIYDWVEV